MQIHAYQTPIVKAHDDLTNIVAAAIPQLPERSVVVIASKIFATAENRIIPKTAPEGDKDEKHALARQESEWYLDPHSSKYNVMLTVKRNWMFANAGIDESNSEDSYILWPKDPQASLNAMWEFLRNHFGVKELGLTMSDSASIPLNWGVTGHAIAHCGFNPLRSYIGKPDLFGRLMKMEQTNIAQSLTAIASVEMGEGDEQTPLAVISDITNIEFKDQVPTEAELAQLHISLDDDVFAPLLTKADWHQGGGGINTH